MAIKIGVKPASLFGYPLDGMFQVTKGRTPVALVKTSGTGKSQKLHVLSIQDRAGGKIGEIGTTAAAIKKRIRQIVGDAQTARVKAALRQSGKPRRNEEVL